MKGFEDNMFSGNKLSKTDKITIITIVLTVSSPFIYGAVNHYIFNPPSEEISNLISVNKNLDEIITFEEMVNFSSISFDSKSMDSLETCELDKSFYRHGEEITLTLKINDITDDRKISALLIDTNNFVRMVFPLMDSHDINQIIKGSTTFQNIIRDETNIDFILNKEFEICFSTEFAMLKSNNIITRGDWRICVIIWKSQIDSSYKPTLMLTKQITFEGYQEYPEEDLPFIIIFSSVSIVLGALSILLIDFLKEKKKKTKDTTKENKNMMINEFKTITDLKLSEDKTEDLYLLMAISKYDNRIKRYDELTVEGHNKKLQTSYAMESLEAENHFSNLIKLGYAVISGNYIRLTKKGKAFVEFLEKEGFILDLVNDIVLTPAYVSKVEKNKQKNKNKK